MVVSTKDYASQGWLALKISYYAWKVVIIKVVLRFVVRRTILMDGSSDMKTLDRKCTCGSVLFVLRSLVKGNKRTDITVCMRCDRGKCKTCGEPAGTVLNTGPQRCDCGGST